MRILASCLLLSTSTLLLSEEKSELAPTAKEKYDFTFLPETVAVYQGEELSNSDFLKLLQPRLKKLVSQIQNRVKLRDICLAFLDDYYKRKANLDLAYKSGLSINQGLAELELSALEEKIGKLELEQQFEFTGLDFSEAAKFYAESKIINRYFSEQVFKKVTVSEADALVYYFDNEKSFTKEESIKIVQMFFPFGDELTKKEAQKRAGEALKDLSAGQEFSAVAKKHGSSLSLAAEESSQYFSEAELRPSLRKSFKLKVGMFSGALESEQGIHIIKVLERRAAGILPFKAIKDKLIQTLVKAQAMKELKENILLQLKSSNFKVFIK
ncbi:MAG: peptidyl-prolyl cis-trans isomerase [Lentisphaeraceae bacterium]|nr:peptidyl-prolyl cis-trans isomerase [Lentisphaeraceae bacterium]